MNEAIGRIMESDKVELVELLKEVLYAPKKRQLYNIMATELPISYLNKMRTALNRIDPKWRRTRG